MILCIYKQITVFIFLRKIVHRVRKRSVFSCLKIPDSFCISTAGIIVKVLHLENGSFQWFIFHECLTFVFHLFQNWHSGIKGRDILKCDGIGGRSQCDLLIPGWKQITFWRQYFFGPDPVPNKESIYGKGSICPGFINLYCPPGLCKAVIDPYIKFRSLETPGIHGISDQLVFTNTGCSCCLDHFHRCCRSCRSDHPLKV